jgi:hypothetical protein
MAPRERLRALSALGGGYVAAATARLAPPPRRPSGKQIRHAVPSGLKLPGLIHRGSFLRSRGRSCRPAPVRSDQYSSIGWVGDQPQKAGIVLVGLLQCEPAVSCGAGVIHIRTPTQRGTLIPKARPGKNVSTRRGNLLQRSARKARRTK